MSFPSGCSYSLHGSVHKLFQVGKHMLHKKVWKQTKPHLHSLLLNGSPSATPFSWQLDPSETNQMQLAILKKQIPEHLSWPPWQKKEK